MQPPDFKPEGEGQEKRPSVWVLVGSMGAMTAARRFFDRLSPDRPLAFVFAIRIDPQWAPLVANLLARTTAFRVGIAGLATALHARDLRVIPADGGDEEVSISGLESRTVDDILGDIAEHYGERAGVIVLSGIGAEGVRGCRAILRHGGRVWTQDFESCRFSSLPRHIHDCCEVTFSAPPEALAARVAEGVAASDVTATHAGKV